MTEAMKGIEPVDWLKMNAKLQQKKNKLRKMLKDKGMLKKGAENKYDNYKYFSEAQYKQLFTELFSECALELSFTEVSYDTFTAEGKQSNGRLPKLKFKLTDIETGFSETSVITGEGIDKGDKAGFKAYTGALKYYLATTFMVATGDDPEKESPDAKADFSEEIISEKEKEVLKAMCEKAGVNPDEFFHGKLNTLKARRYAEAVNELQKRIDQK